MNKAMTLVAVFRYNILINTSFVYNIEIITIKDSDKQINRAKISIIVFFKLFLARWFLEIAEHL